MHLHLQYGEIWTLKRVILKLSCDLHVRISMYMLWTSRLCKNELVPVYTLIQIFLVYLFSFFFLRLLLTREYFNFKTIVPCLGKCMLYNAVFHLYGVAKCFQFCIFNANVFLY